MIPRRITVTALAALTLAAPLSAQRRDHPAAPARPVPTPASILGYEPGTDRHLVAWDTVVRYFRALGAASPRVRVRELGRTTDSVPFLAVFISSPANLARLPALAEQQRRLADPRLIKDSAEAARLIEQGRTFVLMTSSIHSTEVGGFFSPLQIAYRLATAPSAEDRMILDRIVLMLVPSMNPDGVNIVSHWYQQTLGTSAEGTSPPELYHHYTGHDNNRDWYAFSQVETRMVVDSLYDVWHPQVTMDIHQMGSFGPRIFLPPYMDPVEPNIDPIITQGDNALGADIARRLTLGGLPGVSINSTYDEWTPARAFQHYHGAVRILQETASAQLATPITVSADSLRPGLGVDPRQSSWSFVQPWMGGRWTLADILRYQTTAAMAMLGQVARSDAQWRQASYTVAKHNIDGFAGWPWAYVVPTANQDRAALATLLEIMRHGQVEVRQALQPFSIGNDRFTPGTYVITLRQPYAGFAKALLERQDYPDLRQYPGGPPKPPYDVTAQTLPLLLGVRVYAVRDSLAVSLSAPTTTVEAPVFRAGGLTVPAGGRPSVRIGLYKSWSPSMDEGWTRYIFDTWDIPYESVTDSMVRAGSLGARYDAIVLPDQSPRQLVEGLSARRYPARIAGGFGTAGVQSLKDFVEGGGTLVALNQSCDFVIDALELPVTNVLAGLSNREFYAPGSIFRLVLDTTAALAKGMSAETIAWFESGPAFDVRDPARARVIGRYPATPSDVLLSGWILGPANVAGKAAIVDVKQGRGHVILFGFRPQYRAQSQATYPLFFNALRGAADR